MADTLEIGPAEINKAMSDANFYAAMPEFASLRVKMDAAKAGSNKGCTPCKLRRIMGSANADFMRILPTLSDDGKKRLKKYYGVDSIKYNTIDRIARKTYVVTI